MFSPSIPLFVIATTLFAHVFSQSTVSVHGIFESLEACPPGFSIHDEPVDGSSILSLRLHLRQQNVVEFEQMVYDISTPGHPSYGEHMTQYAIDNILQPRDETLKLATDWIPLAESKNSPSLESNFLHVNTTVTDAEVLLKAKYAFFRHDTTGMVVLRTLSYSLALELHEHIDMVHPTTYFPGVNAMKTKVVAQSKNPPVTQRHHLAKAWIDIELEKRKISSHPTSPTRLDVASCNTTVTPDCVKALYGFEDFVPSTSQGNKFAIAGYREEYVRDDDLVIFEEIYANETVGTGYGLNP